MAKKLFTVEKIQAIGNKIRSLLGVSTLYNIDDMPTAIQNVYNKGKQDGGGGGITPSGEISITTNGTHDVTKYASAKVDVPSSGITPSGTISIEANGTGIDVAKYAKADVDVPIPEGYIKPTGTKNINTNGTSDVREFAEVFVDIPMGGNMQMGVIENKARATTLTINVSKSVTNLIVYDTLIATSTGKRTVFAYWSKDITGASVLVNQQYVSASGHSFPATNATSASALSFDSLTLTPQVASGTGTTANAWGVTTYRWIAW